MNVSYDVLLNIKNLMTVKTGIKITQNDSGIQLRIKLMDGDKIFNDSGATVTIVFLKPDQLIVVGELIKDGDIYVYHLTGNELSKPGSVVCDIKANYIDGRVSSSKFIFEVEIDTINDSSIDSSTYIQKLDYLLDDANNIVANLETRADILESEYAPRLTNVENITAEIINEYAKKSEVTNSLTPKGKIAYGSLPTNGNTIGDYYYCSDGDETNGAGNYVWNGTDWYFGGSGDEGYNMLKEDLDELDNDIYELYYASLNTGTGFVSNALANTDGTINNNVSGGRYYTYDVEEKDTHISVTGGVGGYYTFMSIIVFIDSSETVLLAVNSTDRTCVLNDIKIPPKTKKIYINYMTTCGVSISISIKRKRVKFDVEDAYIKSLKILCIGDSLTEGDYGSNPRGTMNVHPENYPYFMQKYLNCDVVNKGSCGATSWSYWNNNIKTYDISEINPDVIIIMLGTNSPITDTLETDVIPYSPYTNYQPSMCGSLCKIIEYCYEKTQNKAQIILCTPPNVSKTLTGIRQNVEGSLDGIKSISKYYNIPLIDAHNECGWNDVTVTTTQPIDGLHGGLIGYKKLGIYIGSKVKSIASFVNIIE